MRKWNTILSVLMLLIFMIHGIMGSFMLNGVGSSAGKLLAWIGVGILVVHTVIGVILTVQSLQTAKQSGKMYLKQNAIFWARRASSPAGEKVNLTPSGIRWRTLSKAIWQHTKSR